MIQSTRRTIRCLVVGALASFASIAIAHEGDPKERDFKGPYVGPAWLADEHVGEKSGPAFQSSGVRLMAWFPVGTFNAANTGGNDVWGYVSPSGREYALMGLSHGTGFVEVTNPGSSRIIGFIAGPTSTWRNVKTYRNYAYAVSEGGGGIQVFSLANIDNGVVSLVNTVDASAATPATHTMIINEQTGYLYRMGGGTNGLRIYSLANPAAPVMVSTWNPKYTHDGVVYNYTTGPYAGKEIFFACGGTNGGQTNTGVDILDVTNKAAITTIGRFTYANANFTHQLWVSEDRRYGYINDELDLGPAELLADGGEARQVAEQDARLALDTLHRERLRILRQQVDQLRAHARAELLRDALLLATVHDRHARRGEDPAAEPGRDRRRHRIHHVETVEPEHAEGARIAGEQKQQRRETGARAKARGHHRGGHAQQQHGDPGHPRGHEVQRTSVQQHVGHGDVTEHAGGARVEDRAHHVRHRAGRGEAEEHERATQDAAQRILARAQALLALLQLLRERPPRAKPTHVLALLLGQVHATWIPGRLLPASVTATRVRLKPRLD